MSTSLQPSVSHACLDHCFQYALPLKRHSVKAGAPIAWQLLLMSLPFPCVAQSPDITSLEAYVNAIKQPQIPDQIASMEHFLEVSGQSNLRLDALEILVMDYQQVNNSERAVSRAHDLLNFDPSNPLAVAVLNTNGVPPSNRKARNDEFSAARRGLTNVDLLHKPEGMSQAQFAQLQQKVRGMLAGAIGMGYLDQQDYQKAVTYLQQAVAAEPQNGRYNYGLAQAILSSPNGNNADAYWLLAKAVTMSKGTAYEQQISHDALAKYKENGGSEAVWNQLLAAAAASNVNTAQQNGAQPVNAGQPQQSAPASGTTVSTNPQSTSTSSTNPVPGGNPPTATASPNIPSTGNSSGNASSVQPANNSAPTTVTVEAPPSNAAVNNTGVGNAAGSPSTNNAASGQVGNSVPPAAAPNTGTASTATINSGNRATSTIQPAAANPADQPPSTTAQPTNTNTSTANPPAQPANIAAPPGPQASTNASPAVSNTTRTAQSTNGSTWIPFGAKTSSAQGAPATVPPSSTNMPSTPAPSNQATPNAPSPSPGSGNVPSSSQPATANPPTAANRSANSSRTQNTPVMAKASPPPLPGSANSLPESDQPSLVLRPPITSSTPRGPTTAPLPDRKPAVAPPPVVSSPIITAPTGPVSL